MTAPEHQARIIDRGAEHVHRFKIGCTCGWWAPTHRRTRRAAKRTYRDIHTRRLPRTGRVRKPSRTAAPRPVTPHDQLPEELQ